MLEISREDEELETPTLEFEDDEGEDLVEKVQEMRKKVEEQLGMTTNFNEDELKHEVILEKVKSMAEDSPEEVASLLQALLSEEAEIPKSEKGS
jgi:flagellar M-ring protein FliF